MHGDVALSKEILDREFPDSHLTGEANLLMMPNVDAANITYNLLSTSGNGITVGAILLGRPSRRTSSTPSPACGASST